MANIENLNKALEKTLQGFMEEINFDLETFDQNNKHPDGYLTKADFEELAKQTFYMLGAFKDVLIKYLQENSK